MKVAINFPSESKRKNSKSSSIIISIEIPLNLARRVVEKTIKTYSQTLKDKYLFEKVEIKKVSPLLYELVCQPNQQMPSPLTTELFFVYLSSIGFVSITTKSEFESMEMTRLEALNNQYSMKKVKEESLKKYISRKTHMNKQEFLRLLQKLAMTRDMIEQLEYQGNEILDWSEKIVDCDLILDNIHIFYWDFGFFVLVDCKMKQALYNYSDFYDNMKESHSLTTR